MSYRGSMIRVLIFIAFAGTAQARDLWVVLGSARGPENGCAPIYTWSADAYFHNVGSDPESLSVIELSNGGGSVSREVTVMPRRAVSLTRGLAGQVLPSGLFVARIRTTDQVLGEGRLEYVYENRCLGIPPVPFAAPVGKGTFPVFTALVPPLVEQPHFGTDLGVQQSRINVGVYNDGLVTATATVEIRRPACAEFLAERRSVQIPPKSIVQFPVKVPAVCDGGDPLLPVWTTDTTVVVDQPSLSYASVISNQQPPVTSFGVGTSGQ